MGWFWADTSSDFERVPSPDTQALGPGCPIRHQSSIFNTHPSESTTPVPSTGQGSCPYSGSSTSTNDPIPFASSPSSRLNPLNRMPNDISQSRSANQTIDLPTDRSVSTIPKGHMDDEGNWVYPSPQQMYNALLRKGYTDTPQDAMEEMVAVHNFLNEGAWAEIVEWERRFAGGLARGWRECRRGEAGSRAGATIGFGNDDDRHDGAPVPQPRLLKFEGRPKEMTPKASLVQLMGWIYPAKFGCEPPFDRHDWYIQRQDPHNPSRPREIRYVIDYYSAPPEPASSSTSSSSSSSSSLAAVSSGVNDTTETQEEDSQAVFYLDVRPAVDGPRAAMERLLRWSGDVWWRASGGDVTTRPANSSSSSSSFS